MIDQITGTIVSYYDMHMVVHIGPIHVSLLVPRGNSTGTVTLSTHLVWHQETGPQLFGFETAEEREIFLLLLTVPKIGPKIAVNILAQIDVYSLVHIIAERDLTALSKISGVGPKKAEQITTTLSDTAKELLRRPEFAPKKSSGRVWHQLSEALASLGYARAEIGNATSHLREVSAGKELLLDKLLRSALAYLSQQGKM